MSYNRQLGSVLELLHLRLIEKDNFLYVLNHSNEELSRVSNERNGLRFEFTRDGIKYSCNYNDRSIAVTSDQNDSITFSSGGIIYQKKEDATDYNKTFVILSDHSIIFYQVDNDGISTSIKTEYGFKSMKKSVTIPDNGCYKEDITVEEIDGIPTEKHVIRKYNEDGAMLTGKLFDVTLQVPVEEYIKNELATNPVVSDSLNQMNGFIPNVVNFCSYSMPIVSQIIDLVNNNQTNK